MKKRNMAKWYLPILAIWAVLLVVVAVVQGFDTRAKYTMTKDDDVEAVAQAFYFESDLLDGGTYELPAGTKTITFTLKNYADSLRYAETDIKYEIKLDGVKKTEGTLATGATRDEGITITVEKAGTYTVAATAAAPYSKTLQAKFVVTEATNGITWEVNDSVGSPIVQLTVRTGDYGGNLQLVWPAGVYPDNTDALMASAVGASTNVHFENHAEYTFVFFKDDHNVNYETQGGFNVKRN
jgi:hypothetical protein